MVYKIGFLFVNTLIMVHVTMERLIHCVADESEHKIHILRQLQADIQGNPLSDKCYLSAEKQRYTLVVMFEFIFQKYRYRFH